MNNEIRRITNEIAFHAVILLIVMSGMTCATNCHIDSKFDNLEKMIAPEKNIKQLKIENLERQVEKLTDSEKVICGQ